jgi:hypothetical protein
VGITVIAAGVGFTVIEPRSCDVRQELLRLTDRGLPGPHNTRGGIFLPMQQGALPDTHNAQQAVLTHFFLRMRTASCRTP